MTRGEVFEGTGPTSASHIRAKLGATREGKLIAADCTLVYEAGAFPGSPVPSGCRTMLAPYEVPNSFIEGIDVVVNTQKAAAYRAPGSPTAAFAAESVIDESASNSAWTRWSFGCATQPRREAVSPPARYSARLASWKHCKRPRNTRIWRSR